MAVSKDEASSAYYAAKSQYNSAAGEYRKYENESSSCRGELRDARNQYSQCSNDKINFEKRVEDIERIINCLEGNGGWLSVNVPQTIATANKSAQDADNGFRQCIKCSGINPPDLAEVFKAPAVTEDQNSNTALEEYKKEKARLEQAIEELKKQMAQLSQQADELSKRIQQLGILSQSCKQRINQSISSMYYYRKYM
jgi:chromosome segregation ATPase